VSSHFAPFLSPSAGQLVAYGLWSQGVDVLQVAVASGIVDPVAYDEFVRNIESEVAYVQLELPARRLREQAAEC
jgi:hypothetical protein